MIRKNSNQNSLLREKFTILLVLEVPLEIKLNIRETFEDSNLFICKNK